MRDHDLSSTAVFAAWACFVASACNVAEDCANSPISRLSSPDGSLMVYVFDRDCGATTGFSTQVSVLTATSPLPNEPGNILILDGDKEVRVEWKSDHELVLEYDTTAHVSRAEKTFGSVQIRHATMREGV